MSSNRSTAVFKYELSNFGMETLGRYYGTYPAEVENYYPELDRVDLRVKGLIKGLDFLAFVPIKKDPNINIPIQKDDKMLVTFMFGLLTMPLAEFAYHSEKHDYSSKDERITSKDFYQLLTPNGLLLEEIEKGFQIVKGKLKLVFTEDEIKIETSRGKVTIDGDFSVVMDTGAVKMNSTTGNTMININSLVAHINQLGTIVQTHLHPITPYTPATPVQSATPTIMFVPSLLTSTISVSKVKGG